MKRRMIALILMTSMLLTACSTKGQQKETIMVLAASSLTDALNDIKKQYEESQSDYNLEFSFDSSGTCKMQIEQGVQADVFFSASSRPVKELAQKDLVLKDSVTDVLKNEVVLISKKDSSNKINSFEKIVNDKNVSMIATCMEEVPIGQYTAEIYKSLGLKKELDKKANYASNVRQVLDWVATGNAPYGIVYATDAAIEDKVQVLAKADSSLYEQVMYQAAVIKKSDKPDVAKSFIEYLKSDDAKKIFKKYGFETVS